jgi:uncharacterized membrane protein (Fun14 family)
MAYLAVVYRKPCIFCRWWIPVWHSRYAIKKVMKIAAIVIGLFVVGLLYLSYRGWIDVKWMEMENATRATLTNVAGQAVHALNNTATQFAAHSTTVEAAGLPVAAASGFMPGLVLGLRKG